MQHSDPFASHGGLLIPLDMFRVSHIAGVMGEALIARARNILDAQLVLTRHPASQLLLGRIVGSVVGTDPASFWRENADLALAVSQVIPRQAFLYYVCPGPGADRREGFMVAQRGQVLAADDAAANSLPAGAGPDAWPVTRLCEQMGLTVAELAGGFAGGPSITIPLMEPRVDDQAALMTLAGQDAGEDGADAEPAAAPAPVRNAAAEDARRRAAQQAADEAAARVRAEEVTASLPSFQDELGVVVAPKAELGEPEILAPFVVTAVHGDLPDGLPRTMTDALQGKRLDVAVKVDFLSEVFVDNTPLSRSTFDARATAGTVGGTAVRTLEVLAPRIGYGTLVVRDRSYAFVSRRPGMPLPEALIVDLLK